MKLIEVKDYDQMIQKAVAITKNQICEKTNSVLGLATGSTMLGVYKELIAHYIKGEISFSGVTTFNLDEYYPIQKDNLSSFHSYMEQHFFCHVNVKKSNINIPNGSTTNPWEECKNYEKKIEKIGGIDLQFLGIGRNGHIGFNEPQKAFTLKTHLTNLDTATLEDNVAFFMDGERMPRKAITLGIKKIMEARKVILLASGEEKSEALSKMMKEVVDPRCPASILQLHPNIIVIADQDACKKLH
jgi:glucosamine-6-phosphate deaminase